MDFKSSPAFEIWTENVWRLQAIQIMNLDISVAILGIFLQNLDAFGHLISWSIERLDLNDQFSNGIHKCDWTHCDHLNSSI